MEKIAVRRGWRIVLAWGLALLSGSGAATISGRVLDDSNSAPIVGAQVRLQADLLSPVAITNAQGEYTLAVEPSGQVAVAAAVPYDHTPGAQNYATGAEGASNGAVGIDIRLLRIPAAQATMSNYNPQTAQFCGICHPDQRSQWAASRHANADNNPWMLDLFSGTGTPGGSAGYVYISSHGSGASGFCATCHAPMQDVFTPGLLRINEASTQAGTDGVTCLACHQIAAVDAGNINGLHHIDKTTMRFPAGGDTSTELYVNGPLPDVNADTMRNVYNPLFKQALLCASCHQYTNPANGAPGQNTYMEWSASAFAVPGPNFKVCQDCHMPPASEPGTLAITSAIERPGEQRRNHQIVGSTQAALSAAILLRVNSAVVGNELVITAEIENRGAGHSFPTGFSIRNALLWVEASRNGTPLTQISGPTLPTWADDDVPGVQLGDLSGRPGSGFVKLLRGRINGQGAQVQPVIFVDAETVVEDSVLASGATRTVELRFAVPSGATPDELSFDARLLWRRAFRALAVTKGWTTAPGGGPIEVLVARATGVPGTLFRNGFE